MKTTLTIVVLLFACAVNSQEPPKFAMLYDFGDFIFTEGIWVADKLTEKTELAFSSVTRVECYKHGGQRMTESDAYCMQATAQVAFSMPSIQVDYYPVLSWDTNRIVAADSPTAALPDCIWTQITINLRDKTVAATDTRKLGKGHEGFKGACKAVPLTQTYHLVESTSEMIRRELREHKKTKQQQ